LKCILFGSYIGFPRAGNATTTTTKPFVPSIWGRLHEPKENYAGTKPFVERRDGWHLP